MSDIPAAFSTTPAHSPVADRLVPVREGMDIVGVKSPTSYYRLINTGELPPLIHRGSRSFHLESDLLGYIAKLAARREVA